MLRTVVITFKQQCHIILVCTLLLDYTDSFYETAASMQTDFRGSEEELNKITCRGRIVFITK